MLYFQYPTVKTTSSKAHRIPCQINVTLWLGKMADEEHFTLENDGEVSVVVETVTALLFYTLRFNMKPVKLQYIKEFTCDGDARTQCSLRLPQL